jgi:redox-sensitive bicupin YhaK (pirin superfamily)
MHAGVFGAGETLSHTLGRAGHAWVQVVRGSVRINGTAMRSGDGLALSHEQSLAFMFDEDSEILVFELT